MDELHHTLLDVARGRFGGQRVYDGQDLLGHDGQHLDIDAVELVEAAPGARLGQAWKVAAHGLVVEAFRAVDHNDVAT